MGSVAAVTNILIADDHHLVRKGLRGLLEAQRGWTVVAEAGDGYEAIDAALRTLPDVAIIDCSMPRMNGLEATRRIHERLPKTEVCLFADREEDGVIVSALQVGARGIVLKSDSEKELLTAVESLARHQPYFSCVVPESLLGQCRKRNGHSPKSDLLTPREREVVQLVAEGLSNKEVGKQLDLSVKTVETHRGAAMRKAGLSSTADLVRYAVRNHLVQP
jgi:DNA-binding NarL/FixJ family response regulator